MKGDFTRWSFRPQQHYHGVLKQQGRVDLDSDWNEQGAIVAHRVETETIDVVGASGAPQGDAGFMIQAASGGANLTISAGRAYVDGILCENEQANLAITAQPDLPGFSLPTTPGMYVAYLKVWERHITYLDDQGILEVALGGPDTCTRAKTIWQVNLIAAGAPGSGVTCSTDVPAYDTLIAPSSGKLKAQAQPATSSGPCAVPATAGYKSLENQLYRVEIHNTGSGDATAGSGTATFKWSRDNGSVVASWISPPSGQTPAPNTLFVSSTGKDSVLGFAAGQWIELSDDTRELNFQPGTLVQLTNVQGQVLTVDPGSVIPAGGSLKLSDYPSNPKVRRWDSAGATPTTTGTWLNLENGIQVWFDKGTYTAGDYWLIPARTLTGNINWPVDGVGNPVLESPKGIQTHYCRLAVVEFDGKVWSLIASCLALFPPLTNVTAGADKGVHITDVRTAVPDAPLLNDSHVPLTALEEFTIKILCDAPLDPVSVKPATCLVTLDLSYPPDVGNTGVGVWGLQPLLLPATIALFNAAASSQILLTLQRASLDVIRFGLLTLQNMKLPVSMLAHINLKGDFIWSKNDPTVYLDGDAFGTTRTDADGSTHIGLRLPSGDGKRGGNFDMWFRFVLPVTLNSLTLSPTTVNSGQPSTGTLILSGPAPIGGAVITLSSNNSPIIGALPSVTIPENQTSSTFPITKTQLSAGVGSVAVQITGTYGASSAPPATLTINAQISLTKLAFSTAAGGPITSIPGGGPVTLTATLNVAALTQVVIPLTSNASQAPAPTPAATVPTSITVQQGSTTGQVTVQIGQRGSTFGLQVTGTFGGPPVTASLNITAPGAGPAPAPPTPATPISG
jgi:Family of unknown function (DUF6519)